MELWSDGGMRPLRIADSATIVLGLQDEIRRSEESRYDHRLHGVLLVAQGLTCPEVAKLLGDARAPWSIGCGDLRKRGWPDCARANGAGGRDG